LSITSGRNNGPSSENFITLILNYDKIFLFIDAELSGINNGDCLIEINGKNIENLDHEQVKQCLLVNKYPASIQMLVTDILTYDYYKKQNKLIHHDLSTVRMMPRNISRECLSYNTEHESDSDDNESHSYVPNGTIHVRKKDYLVIVNIQKK
jgi:hypothetical protein